MTAVSVLKHAQIMYKAVTLCVIVVLLGAPGALGVRTTCAEIQKLIWNGEINMKDQNLETRNFDKAINVVRDLKNGETTFTARPYQANAPALPQVILGDKNFELRTIDVYPLDNTMTSAALELSFVCTSTEPNEFVTFVMPLSEGTSTTLNVDIKSTLNGILSINKDDMFAVNFQKFALMKFSNQLAKIGKPPRVIGSSGNKHHVFLTPCQNVGLLGIQYILSATPAALRVWPQCTEAQRLIWDQEIKEEDKTSVPIQNVEFFGRVTPASGGNQGEQGEFHS